MRKPCKIWTRTLDKYGYGQATCSRKKYGTRRLSRVTWIQHYGPIPEGMQVLHDCDNRACYEETHLFLGTNQDNMADKKLKGRCRQGPTRLTKEQRLEIWKTTRNFVRGMLSDLARKNGVTPTTIKAIRDGRIHH